MYLVITFPSLQSCCCSPGVCYLAFLSVSTGDPAREVAGRQFFISDTGHTVDMVSTRPEPAHTGLAVPSSQVLVMP